MRIVQDDAEAAHFVRAAFNWDFAEPFSGLLILDDKDVVHGVALLNNYEPGLTVDVTFAGRLTPATARGLARYVFNVLKVRRVTAVTRVSNTAAQAGLIRWGFINEGRLRDRFPDEDGLIFGLIRSDVKLRF
jgi:RimJ/RimL family protein N-acetyltransferase